MQLIKEMNIDPGKSDQEKAAYVIKTLCAYVDKYPKLTIHIYKT